MHIYLSKKKELQIYIIIHPKFIGWIKLGRTYDLRERLNAYQTRCPYREYKYAYSKILSSELVKLIEDHFKVNIHNNGGEWYEIPVEDAIFIIETLIKENSNTTCIPK